MTNAAVANPFVGGAIDTYTGGGWPGCCQPAWFGYPTINSFEVPVRQPSAANRGYEARPAVVHRRGGRRAGRLARA